MEDDFSKELPAGLESNVRVNCFNELKMDIHHAALTTIIISKLLFSQYLITKGGGRSQKEYGYNLEGNKIEHGNVIRLSII